MLARLRVMVYLMQRQIFSSYKATISSESNRANIFALQNSLDVLQFYAEANTSIFTERILVHKLVSFSQIKCPLLCRIRDWRLSFVLPNSLLGRVTGVFCLFISDHTMSPISLRVLLLLSELCLAQVAYNLPLLPLISEVYIINCSGESVFVCL
jgi:hypothetical protein